MVADVMLLGEIYRTIRSSVIFIPRPLKRRSFESELRKRCTKKLDGALRTATLYFKIFFESNAGIQEYSCRARYNTG